MGGRVWTRRSRALVGTGALVGGVGLAYYLLSTRTRGAEIAGVLSLSVAVLALVSGWFQRSHDLSRPALAAEARRLAGLVRRDWSRTRQKLLGDTGDPLPANVRYQHEDPTTLAGGALVRWRSDGGGSDGFLADIAGYYATLRRGRLVVVGAPGSGKTVLAIQLLLERIEALPADPGPDRFTVPVLLSLPAWPDVDGEFDDDELSRRLDTWTVSHLVETYQLAEPVALALVTQGWVLPVLDGLDEMDSDVADDGRLPPRAVSVVRALNQDPGTGLRPVVLTCREHRYRRLLTADDAPGGTPVLQDATVVTMQPLTVPHVVEYLAYRFPDPAGDPATGAVETRWHPVCDELSAQPTGALATAMRSPWRLFLAVTGYYASSTRPAEMVGVARTHPDELDDHLLGRLVPALVSLHRRPDSTRYQPADVTRGLATLARHLAWQQAHGGSGTDLHLDQLWRASGPRSARYLHATIAALPLVCGILLFVFTTGQAVTIRAFLDDPLSTPRNDLVGAAGHIVAVVSLIYVAASPRKSGTSRANYRRLRHIGVAEIRELAFWLMGGLVSGLASGLAFWFMGGFAFGLAPGLAPWLAGGLALGLTGGLAAIVESSPQAIERPSDVMREDLAFQLAIGLAIGLAFAIAFALRFGLAVGLAGGLAFGLAFGLATSVWPRFAISGAILARRRATPGSMSSFLDWAYSAGLLRLSGVWCQFRHIEFQRWIERQT